MRTVEELDAFRASRLAEVHPGGVSCEGECSCASRAQYDVAMYEANVPMSYWGLGPSRVQHNKKSWAKYVKTYLSKFSQAEANGYGLMFRGGPASGKTFMLAYVVGRLVRRGRTAYYTTVADLAAAFTRSFDDAPFRVALEQALSSELLAIDDMTRESLMGIEKSAWFRSQITRIVKMRSDNQLVTLIATDCETEELSSVYGPSVGTALRLKCQQVPLSSIDLDAAISNMASKMGYNQKSVR
jgi:DNA replication protein DnaC